MAILKISNSLAFTLRQNPWDTLAFGLDVWDCERLEIPDPPRKDLAALDIDEDEAKSGLFVAKLHPAETEALTQLQRFGFIVRDVSISPTIDLALGSVFENRMAVREAEVKELGQIAEIARSAFTVSRYHSETNISVSLADRRFSNWVRNAFESDSQKVYVADSAGEIVSFFIVEEIGDLIYWHLTAIAPAFQNQGMGWRMWSAMASLAQQRGFLRVQTRISTSNVPVINLYTKLGARFSDPLWVLHYFRE